MLLLVEVHLQTAVAQTAPEEVDNDEPTCSLDPSTKTKNDCSTASNTASSASDNTPPKNDRQDIDDIDLTRQVISLTDETFDELTRTSSPGTWLIMFKTDACAICKKTKPVLESLSVDADIVDHNDKELETMINDNGRVLEKKQPPTMTEEKIGTPKGPVYVWEGPTNEEGETPRGIVYIATIDAGWSGRDTTKRFDIDATPTITMLLLRNEGYNDEESNIDSRSYYIYRGQRATYPLRSFLLGGYAARKQMEMPPPLPEAERKPQSKWGRLYDYFVSPSAVWAAETIGKFLLVWFVFIGVLGLFMRVHNYAWGENADDDDDYDANEEKKRDIEREKAQGREEYNTSESADERSARRQKIMWEQKARNHAKFAATKEARKKKKKESNSNEGGEGGDDEMDGVGFSVKKSDVQKGIYDAQKGDKSKEN